jgi:hypothetical protein
MTDLDLQSRDIRAADPIAFKFSWSFEMKISMNREYLIRIELINNPYLTSTNDSKHLIKI